MKPVLFPSTATSFTTQGIGTLDCASCIVTEERNGIFELEMKISVDAQHFDECVEGNIIVAIHDDTKTRQPFQIYKRSKPINGIVTVFAEHITYRLAKIVVTPFSAGNIAEAFAGLKNNAVEDCPFDFWTDKASEGTFNLEQPASIRAKLGGEAGSILDAFGGGEYKWEDFTVRLYQHRGHDNGVTLRKGKNITDYTKETNVSNVYTGIVPYYMDNGEAMLLPEKVVRLSGQPAGYTVAVDLSDKFEEKPTEAQLRTAAETYLKANAKTEASISGKVSFVALWQTEEYKNIAPLQRVNLCDTVTVVFDSGDEAKAKVVRTVYNVLLERYDEIELGEPKTNMSSAIKAITDALTGDDVTKTEMQKALDHAADLISGGLGGFVVFNRNADGQPQEILIMDTDDKETARNVIRMNKNGIAFSQNGYNGPFISAWTIDGRFVADFITAGTFDASRVNVRNLNAGSINTGTLDASRVNVTNLNASNIVAGTLSANRVRAGVLQDANGNTWNLGGGGMNVAGSFTSSSGNASSHLRNGELITYGGGSMTVRIGSDQWSGGAAGNSGRIVVYDGGRVVFSVDSAGTSIYNYLYVSGRARFNGNVMNSGGGIQFVSDRNAKNNIIALAAEKAKDFIMRLVPSVFKFNNGTSGRDHHGFIAQEVKDAMNGDDWGVYTEFEGTCGVRYDEIIADLVAVVQDQEKRIARLEGKE